MQKIIEFYEYFKIINAITINTNYLQLHINSYFLLYFNCT